MEKLSLTVVVVIISCVFDCQAKSIEDVSTMKSNSGNFSEGDAMSRCNETFRIKPEYLQELNDTGSFPDESEKTPMCFMKCYLETIGVLSSDSVVDKDKTSMMFQLNNEELSDECAKEMSSAVVTDVCEKAYFFIRCIMSRSLLDHLGEDNDNQN